ncbi:Uncharacterised protein [Mycobacteroides abscessus subsp. abscessus]|nr:Uncharacterised protein [Mycobacteroides abscessus subsp. abscessus]
MEDLANNCGMLPEIGECLAEIPDEGRRHGQVWVPWPDGLASGYTGSEYPCAQ